MSKDKETNICNYLNLFDTNDFATMVFDTMPLGALILDENFNIVYSNKYIKTLFEIDKGCFSIEDAFKYMPKRQVNGTLSSAKIINFLNLILENNKAHFYFEACKLDGAHMPLEITGTKMISHGKAYITCFVTDLRQIDEADERARIMFETSPVSCSYWDENVHLIDCNNETLRVFGLNSKDDYLDRFYELSPLYQPDGILSSEKYYLKVKRAFKMGRIKFEWMHRNLSNELIPMEVTLVRFNKGNRHIVVGFATDLREIRNTLSLLEQMEVLAFTDNLTGAYNRHYFMEIAGITLKKRSNGSKVSIIMLDIDHFKNINDTYGHIVGDEVLKEIVNHVKKVLRPCDVLARYGGEEFVVLVDDSTSQIAKILAWRINKTIRKMVVKYKDTEIRATVSLGIATKNDDFTSLNDLIDQADRALYKAKNSGRDTVVSYQDLR